VTDQNEDTATDSAADPIAALTAERDDMKDRLLRMTAEFDNYRKRVDRERRELSEAAAADLIRDLLPIIDDLERAMAAATVDGADPAVLNLLKGIELTHRQLVEQVRRRGVEPVSAIGQMFDPEVHEAVGSVPADGRPDGEIVAEFRKGYRAGGRLLRAAMVQVAKA
jgi:molecular chaperone GrpE